MNSISLLSLFTILLSQTLGQPACTKLESFNEFVCSSPGEGFSLSSLKGPQGDRGQRGRRGNKGEKGSKGEVNCDGLKELILQMTQEALDNHTRKSIETSNLLTEAIEESGNIDNKTTKEQRRNDDAVEQPISPRIQEILDNQIRKYEEIFDVLNKVKKNISSIAERAGRPGKRGPSGDIGMKGARGMKGERGSSGEADYDRVDEMISERVQKVLDHQNQSRSEILSLLTQEADKIRILANKTEQRKDSDANYDKLKEMMLQRIQGVVNNQTQKFSELSESLTRANGKIKSLEDKVEEQRQDGETNHDRLEAMISRKTQDVSNDLTRRYTEISKSLNKAHIVIRKLKNKINSIEARPQRTHRGEGNLIRKYNELSQSLNEANEKIKNLESEAGEQGREWEAKYDRLEAVLSQRIQEVVNNHTRESNETSSLLTLANERIGDLENKIEQQRSHWESSDNRLEETVFRKIEEVSNSQTRKYNRMSTSLVETGRKIRSLESEMETQRTDGETNHGILKAMISQRIQEVLDNQARRYDEISNSLIESNGKIINLENYVSEYCKVKYNGKCFWIEYRYPHITFEEGREICTSQGARPANIYSEEHHSLLLGHLRMYVFTQGTRNAWLGMKYRPQTNTVSLSDGTRAPFLKWSPTYPKSNFCCNMFLEARMDWRDEKQHLVNANRGWRMHAVICEK